MGGAADSSPISVEASVPDLSDEELALFSSLLEQAYALEDEPYAREITAQLRFHLHRNPNLNKIQTFYRCATYIRRFTNRKLRFYFDELLPLQPTESS